MKVFWDLNPSHAAQPPVLPHPETVSPPMFPLCLQLLYTCLRLSSAPMRGFFPVLGTCQVGPFHKRNSKLLWGHIDMKFKTTKESSKTPEISTVPALKHLKSESIEPYSQLKNTTLFHPSRISSAKLQVKESVQPRGR